MLCCVVLCCVALCCVVLCCVVLSCVLLCCVVLRCVVSCCVVLCCVVLCCVIFFLFSSFCYRLSFLSPLILHGFVCLGSRAHPRVGGNSGPPGGSGIRSKRPEICASRVLHLRKTQLWLRPSTHNYYLNAAGDCAIAQGSV